MLVIATDDDNRAADRTTMAQEVAVLNARVARLQTATPYCGRRMTSEQARDEEHNARWEFHELLHEMADAKWWPDDASPERCAELVRDAAKAVDARIEARLDAYPRDYSNAFSLPACSECGHRFNGVLGQDTRCGECAPHANISSQAVPACWCRKPGAEIFLGRAFCAEHLEANKSAYRSGRAEAELDWCGTYRR